MSAAPTPQPQQDWFAANAPTPSAPTQATKGASDQDWFAQNAPGTTTPKTADSGKLPPVSETVANMIGSAAKSLAKVSGPNIMYELLRQHFPQANLPPALGKPNADEIMTTGLLSLIPEAEGEAAATPKAMAETAAPSAAKSAASVLEHPAVKPWADAAQAEAMKIPGANLARTFYRSARGLIEGAPEAPAPPTPAAPPPTPAPIPETNGIPWGSKGQGPLDLRGKMIPQAEVAPVAPAPEPAPMPEPAIPKAPARTLRQAKALGPNAQVLSQSTALGQPVNDIVDQAIPPTGPTQAANLLTKKLVDSHLARGNVVQAEAVIDHAAASANSSWEPMRPQIVPAVQNIRENLAMQKAAESVPVGTSARTPADMLDDRATQQEMNWNLQEHGERAEQEARREFIARNSTGIGKGDLIQQARGGQPEEDLTQTWQKALDQVKAAAPAAGKDWFADNVPASTIPSGAPNATATSNGGAAVQGQPISQASATSSPATSGAKTIVRVPGESASYPATYQVRELSDLRPSHSGITFNANEKYELTNDRNYSNPLNQEKIVTNSAPGRFEPAYHVTDNPDATNGPVVIDSSGHALGGNGRAMILQRVYKYNPEGAAAYKNLLAQKAPQFGISSDAISGMQRPVLVRQIADEDLGVAEKQRAITDFNKSGTAEMTPAERAITDARRVSQNTMDYIGARIEDEGPDGTLSNAMRGQAGAHTLDLLIKDGIVTPQERAAYANENGLTEAGKDRVSKVVIGRFFRDPSQIDSTPPVIRNKIESMAAPLSRVDGIPGWDLTQPTKEALDLLQEVRSHGMKNVDDLLSQQGLWVDARYSPQAVTLAKHLQSTPARGIVAGLRQYAQDAADSQRPLLMGQKVEPEQAFSDAQKAMKVQRATQGQQ
jgi:hypothetical protein